VTLATKGHLPAICSVVWSTVTYEYFTKESRDMNAIARKMRQRRESREFDRALRSASPAMRQELYAAAARQGFRL
jgi:hypothetical protein